MLKKIKISNFHSIGEEVVLSFDSDVPIYPILGANGSGKTTILKALSFICCFMNTSTRSDDVNLPFIPHIALPDSPSCIELEYTENTLDYRYRVEFKNGSLSMERLERRDNVKYACIFSILHNDGHTEFKKLSSDLKKILNKHDKERYASLEKISFFAFLNMSGYFPLLNIESDMITHTYSNINYTGYFRFINGFELYRGLHNILGDNQDLQDYIIGFLQDLDYSISKFVFEDRTIVNNNGNPENMTTTSIHYESENANMTVPWFIESEGTCAIMPILISMYELQKTGGVFIWDELESSIHPLVAKKIISRLKTYVKKGNIQVVFTTHMNEILNEFDKKSIFLVEKTDTLQTDIYTLNDVEGVRKDENFANKYLGGLYGATPDIQGVI